MLKSYYGTIKGLLRVPTYILMLLYFTLGLAYTADFYTADTFGDFLQGHWWQVLSGAVIIAAWYVNGTGLNDYADYEIDQINLKGDKDRPLVVGLASKTTIIKIATIGGALALCLAALISWPAALLVAGLLFLNWTYSMKPLQISRRGGVAPALLPLGYIVLPLGLAYMIGGTDVTSKHLILIAAVYLQFLARILLKDYRDVKGDKQHGKITFLLKHGSARVCQLSITAWLAGVATLAVAFRQELFLSIFPIALLAGCALTFLQTLAVQTGWPHQKPYITAFGRMATGVILLSITALVTGLEGVGYIRQFILYCIISLVFIYSAYQILRRQLPAKM